MDPESQSLEWKQSLTQKEKGIQSLCGMLNTDSGQGTILFGVAPDGSIVGIEPGNHDTAQRSLLQYIHHNFQPDIHCEIDVNEFNEFEEVGKKLLKVSAKRTEGVAYYEFKGVAYIREGPTTRQLKLEEKSSLSRKRGFTPSLSGKRRASLNVGMAVVIIVIVTGLLGVRQIEKWKGSHNELPSSTAEPLKTSTAPEERAGSRRTSTPTKKGPVGLSDRPSVLYEEQRSTYFKTENEILGMPPEARRRYVADEIEALRRFDADWIPPANLHDLPCQPGIDDPKAQLMEQQCEAMRDKRVNKFNAKYNKEFENRFQNLDAVQEFLVNWCDTKEGINAHAVPGETKALQQPRIPNESANAAADYFEKLMLKCGL